jgi:hypothetical protein
MRKRQRQQNYKPSAPMLIMRGLCNDKLETRERMAVQAFVLGYAGMDHFDTIADMQGVLLLAGSTSEARKPAMHYARNILGPVLGSIKERYLRTGKMGCNAEELKVLQAFVGRYRDFWLRQPLSLYEAACEALQKTYDEMAKQKKEAA